MVKQHVSSNSSLHVYIICLLMLALLTSRSAVISTPISDDDKRKENSPNQPEPGDSNQQKSDLSHKAEAQSKLEVDPVKSQVMKNSALALASVKRDDSSWSKSSKNDEKVVNDRLQKGYASNTEKIEKKDTDLDHPDAVQVNNGDKSLKVPLDKLDPKKEHMDNNWQAPQTNDSKINQVNLEAPGPDKGELQKQPAEGSQSNNKAVSSEDDTNFINKNDTKPHQSQEKTPNISSGKSNKNMEPIRQALDVIFRGERNLSDSDEKIIKNEIERSYSGGIVLSDKIDNGKDTDKIIEKSNIKQDRPSSMQNDDVPHVFWSVPRLNKNWLSFEAYIMVVLCLLVILLCLWKQFWQCIFHLLGGWKANLQTRYSGGHVHVPYKQLPTK